MRGWKPWTTQPPAGTPIDPRFRAVTSADGVWLPGRAFLNQLTGALGTLSGSGTSLGIFGGEPAISFGGAGELATNGSETVATGGITAIVRCRAAAVVSALNYASIAGNNGPWVFNYNHTSTSFQHSFTIFAGSYYACSYGQPPVGEWSTIVGVWNGSTSYAFRDGALITTASAAGTLGRLGSTSANFIGADAPGTDEWTGDVALLAKVSYAIDLDFALALSRNPWQLFWKRRRTYSIPGSTGATGSASITEGADTASATGTLGVSGSGAAGEATDIASGSGGISVSGSGAAAEAADTASGTGTTGSSVSGSAAATESPDTASGAGTLSVSGSGAAAEGSDTASGAGSAALSGSGAAAEAADTASATGTLSATGAASAAESADTASGTGTLSATGSAAATESADVATGAGTVSGGAPGSVPGDPYWSIKRPYVRTFTVSRINGRDFTAKRPYTRTFTVDSMSIQFPIKGISEKVPLTFDFTQDLPSGVTLTGAPTLTVSVTTGTDASPSDILNGSAAFNSASTAVIQGVKGGLNGVGYTITCTSPTTQSNLTLPLVGLLQVRRDPD